MAEKQLTDFEEFLKGSSSIIDLRDKIANACDGQKLGDIETAMLMFLANVYIVHLGHEIGSHRSKEFNFRLLEILAALGKAEEDYVKGRYKL
jgi:hypothetical protein